MTQLQGRNATPASIDCKREGNSRLSLAGRARRDWLCLPTWSPDTTGTVMQKKPECCARYRQGLAPVAEERILLAFISLSACQLEQSMKGHIPKLLSGTSFRAGQMQHRLALTEVFGDIIGEKTQHFWATLNAAWRHLRYGRVTCHSLAQCSHKPTMLVAWLHDAGSLFDGYQTQQVGLHCTCLGLARFSGSLDERLTACHRCGTVKKMQRLQQEASRPAARRGLLNM